MTAPRRERVLIAGTGAADRAELGTRLGAAGHLVETTAGADDGLRALDSFRPTVIITDMRDRVDDGTSLVRGIRDHRNGRHIPILVLGDPSHAAEFESLFGLGRVWYLHRGAGWEHVKRTFDTVVARVEVDSPDLG